MKIRNILATALLVMGGGAAGIAMNDPAMPADVAASYVSSVNGEGSPLELLKSDRGTTKFSTEFGIIDIKNPSAADIALLKAHMPESIGAQECLILLISDNKADCFTPTERWEQFDRAE